MADPEAGLYVLLSNTQGDLAHTRYLAWLAQMASFADASSYRRLPQPDAR
jgi:hypothetical protein